MTSLIQLTPTIAIGITAVCFTLGLLIVNVHLLTYGVYSSEFIRSEYVLVGAMCVVLVAIAQLSLMHTRTHFTAARQAWRETRRTYALRRIAFALLITVSPTIAALFYLSSGHLMLDDWETWVAWAFLVLFSDFVRRLVESLEAIWLHDFAEDSDSETSTVHLLNLLHVVVMLIASIATYAYFVHPHLSAAFGGG